jgi:hypothetical protein
MTRQCGAWALISRARASAASNCGRSRTWVEIFSEKILSRPMPCAANASSIVAPGRVPHLFSEWTVSANTAPVGKVIPQDHR